MTSEIVLPPAWVRRVSAYPPDGGLSGAEWIGTVPRLLADALDRWGLAVDGPPRTGWTAAVIPVRRGGERLALKLSWPHPEGEHEALALRTWNGAPAVRLVAALPQEGALLLEYLDADDDLTSVDLDGACRIIGGILRRLHRPAPPRVPHLAPYLEPHLERMTRRRAVPRRVVTRTLGLARDILDDEVPATLLHTDLHFATVLRAPDGDWRAIDPEPLAGHPGFEMLPTVMNRTAELGTGAQFRRSVRHRITLVAEAAGIDIDAAMRWSLVRAGLEVSWAAGINQPGQLTTAIALTKALDD